MGVITLTKEVPCAVAPQKMFRAFCVDLHNMVPNAAPNGVKNIGVHSGAPGEPGCVQQINLADTSHGGKHLKIKLDSVDKNNLSLKQTMTDFQGPASDNVDFITSEVKFEAAAGGGCIIKFKTTYHLKGNTVLKEEDLKAGQEKYVGMYKLVEAHLAQNPRLYAN